MKRMLTLQRHPSTAIRAPSFLERVPFGTQLANTLAAHLNFYRVHLLCFLVVPLVASAIFYASNGEVHIAYIDCLFMCVSAVTVTGLNSVLLADCTTWQQVILFIMMCLGSTSSVSIITILIRRHFFRRKFDYIIANSAKARDRVNRVGAAEAGLTVGPEHTFEPEEKEKERKEKRKKSKRPSKVRADMIRRVDVPVKVNQMNSAGWLREHRGEVETEEDDADRLRASPEPLDEVAGFPVRKVGNPGEAAAAAAARDRARARESALDTDSDEEDEGDTRTSSPPPRMRVNSNSPPPRTRINSNSPPPPARRSRADSNPPSSRRTQFATLGKASIQIDDSSKPDRGAGRRRSFDGSQGLNIHAADREASHDLDQIDEGVQQSTSPTIKYFPRSRTVEFQEEPKSDLRLRRQRTLAQDPDNPAARRRMSVSTMRSGALDRTLTRTGTYGYDNTPRAAKHTGFGGFPNPIVAAAGYARKRIPSVIERQFTMPRTTTIASVHSASGQDVSMDRDRDRSKGVSYITFDAVVGRNSKFHGLTSAQQEELGGVEYRALTALIKIVSGYWLLSQLLAVTVIAPYMTYVKRYQKEFHDPVELNQTFFSFFQVWSAFSNNGMSLVDASMVPFRDAVPVVLVMGLLILGGNTAFPVFLRLVIWTLSKVVPTKSRVRETLQFLLDHPRRCFIYLFPSHQTWFLVFALVVLNSIDWVSFLVLDIGNSEVASIPVGTRIMDGLFQAFAVRAAGFSTVTLANVAPAVQLLYVIMMYIAVYPIALSIRSTNVYEEKSMGVFDEAEDEAEAEARFEEHKNDSPTGYIMYHARKQLTFDMWWLVLAVWLICIIERHNISDPASPWITIFSIMFEICSAYGTVGLSLGTPTKNTSLAGTLRTLSKLVLCAVMIRGRHRGLPIAIDRAVLLPSDLEKHNDDTISQTGDSSVRKRASFSSSSGIRPVMTEESSTSEEATPALTPDRHLTEEPEQMSSLSSKEELDPPPPRNKDEPGWMEKPEAAGA